MLLTPTPKTHRPGLYCPICHTKETPWGWKDAADHKNGESCGCRIATCLNCADETVDLKAVSDRRKGDRRTKLSNSDTV